MAVAARQAIGVVHRPRLRLVKPAKTRNTARACVQARRNFTVFASLITVLALIGIARVWVSVQATEASFKASELRADIKSERYEGDMLEVRQSALGSPSRIQAIAGRAMDMAPVSDVTYLNLTAPTDPRPPKAEQAEVAGVSALQRAVAAFIELTAGEAEVLLIGDVGLASTR